MNRLGAITDEFSPDLETALDAMTAAGLTGAELRVIDGRNIVELSEPELDAVRAAVERRGMAVIGIASPVLKCVLPDAPPVDSRFQQDIFGSSYTIDDQSRLAERALRAAARTGAGLVRVFSYWRTTDPQACFGRTAGALREIAAEAARRGIVVGLENEPACNAGTAAETARLLELVDHPNVQVVWDPANALVAGEVPYPDGYARLPARRIVHVHVKDCAARADHVPEWGPVGEMDVDWPGQLRALARDGYRGWLSLETHWRGPSGDKRDASTICAHNLKDLTAEFAVGP